MVLLHCLFRALGMNLAFLNLLLQNQFKAADSSVMPKMVQQFIRWVQRVILLLIFRKLAPNQ